MTTAQLPAMKVHLAAEATMKSPQSQADGERTRVIDDLMKKPRAWGKTWSKAEATRKASPGRCVCVRMIKRRRAPSGRHGGDANARVDV